jgi:hypothetical protein
MRVPAARQKARHICDPCGSFVLSTFSDSPTLARLSRARDKAITSLHDRGQPNIVLEGSVICFAMADAQMQEAWRWSYESIAGAPAALVPAQSQRSFHHFTFYRRRVMAFFGQKSILKLLFFPAAFVFSNT